MAKIITIIILGLVSIAYIMGAINNEVKDAWEIHKVYKYFKDKHK